MQSIKNLIETPTNFTGSEMTRNLVKSAISKRWGLAEANRYDPYKTARTFRQWISVGRKVRPGERGIRSITFIDKKDAQGNVTGRIKRTIVLFLDRQTDSLT